MNNSNLNQPDTKQVPPQAVSEPAPPAQAQTAIEHDYQQVKSLLQKLKEGLKQKRQAAGPAGQGLPVNRKLLIVILVVFVLSLIMLLVALIAKPRGGTNQPVITPEPTTAAQIGVITEVKNPSRYATDEAVIKVEEEISALDQDLTKTAIKENDLTPPTLDWEINFQK